MSRVKRVVLGRGVLSLLITVAIVLALVFIGSSTAQALSIGFRLDPSGTLGRAYACTVTVHVEDSDLLPVTNVDLYLYKSGARGSYEAHCANLPLGHGVIRPYSAGETGGGPVSVTASTAAGWGYGYGYRGGYGYGYEANVGYGYGYYDFGYGYGYGYGYSPYVGTTSITYDVVWTPPSNWPAGGYTIEARVNANGKYFTQTSGEFTLSAIIYAYGEPTPEEVEVAPPEAELGVTDVSDVVTTEGVFTEDCTIESEDDMCELFIEESTIGLTKEGEPLSEISIIEVEEPPAPPADASIVGLTYDLGPDGATFDPPITLTFTYDPGEIPEGVNEEDLVIALWDEDAGEWVECEGCIVDTVNNTISVSVSHFSKYTIMARVAPPPEEEEVLPPPVAPEPAVFSVSTLTVRPAEVESGETVIITVSVANAGGTEGSYTVVLKINGVKEAEKSVTIAAGSSELVTFSITKEAIGSYSVAVDGLSGSFTVVTPPPEEEVVPEEEVPAKPNWGLIGGIIAAAVVIAGLLVYFLWWRRRPV